MVKEEYKDNIDMMRYSHTWSEEKLRELIRDEIEKNNKKIKVSITNEIIKACRHKN